MSESITKKIDDIASGDVNAEAKTLLAFAKEAQESGEMPDLSRLADPFEAFWGGHAVHQSGFDDDTLAKFREFAAGVWNAARFELGCQHLSAMEKLYALGLNPEFHTTLDASVDGVVRMVSNLRKGTDTPSPA